MQITKRNGKKEIFDVEKIHKIIEWAIEGLSGVTLSDIEMNAKIRLNEGITTRDIHKVLIESAANLISLETPNYQFVAARLLVYELRKEVWGGKQSPRLLDFIKKSIDKGTYTKDILDLYSESEINKIGEWIDHERDYKFTYAGIKTLCDKYLIQDRISKEIHETPQFAYILIAMVAFSSYGENRLKYVKKAYDFFSKFKINLPTPLMAGMRSGIRQYSSCCLIDCDDTLDSIFASVTAVGKATADRFGIGLNVGRIRGINSSVNGGAVVHTGLIPFLKVFESTVKSCHQNGIRGGSATINVPIWHYEIEDILVLKNNAGTDDNRVRKLDYCIHFSKLFYERVISGGDVTLFSPHEVKELYDAFGTDSFDELYQKCEADPSITMRKSIPARRLMALFTKERVETGRIYFMNIDRANQHGSWKGKVNMTNLCVEITQPTIPIQDINDQNGEIGTCILSAINLIEINSDAELEKVCDITIRMLENIIDYQQYFAPAAENFTKNRRSLGVGITNLAAYFAKHKVSYEDSQAIELADEIMEKVQYFLLKSSNKLAEEKGACEKFAETKYADGLLPIDWREKNTDSIVKRKSGCDWETLRESIKKFGLRHSTVSAIMPCESSSVIQCSTNGIEPVRQLLTYKKSKANTLPVMVPSAAAWQNRYTLAYDMKSNSGLINVIAALQRWVDMSISMNFYYNYAHYDDGKLADKIVIRDILDAYKKGIKTGYYLNTDDGDKQSVNKKTEENSCESGACSI